MRPSQELCAGNTAPVKKGFTGNSSISRVSIESWIKFKGYINPTFSKKSQTQSRHGEK